MINDFDDRPVPTSMRSFTSTSTPSSILGANTSSARPPKQMAPPTHGPQSPLPEIRPRPNGTFWNVRLPLPNE